MSSSRSLSGAWHRARPLGFTFALVLGVTAILGFAYFQVQPWTPLKSYWFPTYLWSSIAHGLDVQQSRYRLLAEVQGDRGQPVFPSEKDVVPGKLPLPNGRVIPFTLTEEAYQHGKRFKFYGPTEINNAKLAATLQELYYGQSLKDMAKVPLLWGLGVFASTWVLAIPFDRKRAMERRDGRRLKGPEMLTVAGFNHKLKADGIGFPNAQRRTFGEWLLRRDASMVRIPEAMENSHISATGDTGAGKSSILFAILFQVRERNESAIIHDSALEFTEALYDESRGDIVLNPLDDRMPYWNPADEIQHEAEALTIATSLFPDNHNIQNQFFVEAPRKIFAHLLTLRPTPEELVWWLSHEQELDRRLKGTELAAMIYPGAAAQRAGVLASLNMVAGAFKLLPRKDDTTRIWSTIEWAKKRQGWIFLTSTPETRERLLPLTSLWLDLLVLRLMNQGRPGPCRTWFVLDEVANLQRLPQLHTAMTENRKSGNPVVLGFQGRSQLEKRYGLDAETMLSQPATKIFLRTTEPKAAKWISDAIGEVELELVKETRTDSRDRRNSRSFHKDRTTQPLLLPSEIQGLPDLEGYIKHGNLVTRFRTLPIERDAMARGFLPRRPILPPPPTPERTNPAPGSNGAPAQELTPGDEQQQQSILEND